jgi:hypothetical protein
VIYKGIAKTSFDIIKTITENSIKVISNKGWLHNNKAVHKEVVEANNPLISLYILALAKFNDTFKNNAYLQKMEMAFSFWETIISKQIIYNPCTGGCYDGLEEDYINLNQGAEST